VDPLSKPYPTEVRDDVVCVSCSSEPGRTYGNIAADFGMSESCLAI